MPMEVMGLMLGEFVDDYTVKVVDVFAMPQVRFWRSCFVASLVLTLPSRPASPAPAAQSGTGVSVEAVDPVFQTKMLDMLKQTGRCVARFARQRKRASTAGLCQGHTRRRSATSTHPCSPLLPPAPAAVVEQAGDGGWMVPQPSGFRVLAVGCGHEHAAVV